MTSCPQGAVVTCLAKGGPAETDGQIQIGDSLVYVDDLDVRDLMNNVRAARPPQTLPTQNQATHTLVPTLAHNRA
jgi:C-terminal processing protease CtpA/Prc